MPDSARDRHNRCENDTSVDRSDHCEHRRRKPGDVADLISAKRRSKTPRAQLTTPHPQRVVNEKGCGPR